MSHHRTQNDERQDFARPIADALSILMGLRAHLPYRGRGFMILNAACWHLSEYFWEESERRWPLSTARYCNRYPHRLEPNEVFGQVNNEGD
jgi:hypothetical protein